MAQIVRWNPSGFLFRIEGPVGFDGLFHDLGLHQAWRVPDALPDVRFDAVEAGLSCAINAGMPRPDKENIGVPIDGRRFMIGTGTRRKAGKGTGASLYTGRNEGHVQGSLALPQEVESRTAPARCENRIPGLPLSKNSRGDGHRIEGEPKAAAGSGGWP